LRQARYICRAYFDERRIIDRKVLVDIAMHEGEAFSAIIAQARAGEEGGLGFLS
jgi:ribosomal protein L20